MIDELRFACPFQTDAQPLIRENGIEPGHATRRKCQAGQIRRCVECHKTSTSPTTPPAEAVPYSRPASAPCDSGSAMFRVSRQGEGIDDADTLEWDTGTM